MTEEQANEVATRLTVALLEAGRLPGPRESIPQAEETAQYYVGHWRAIQKELLAGSQSPQT